MSLIKIVTHAIETNEVTSYPPRNPKVTPRNLRMPRFPKVARRNAGWRRKNPYVKIDQRLSDRVLKSINLGLRVKFDKNGNIMIAHNP